MTDTKVTPEKKIKVVFVPENGISNYKAPTPAELNAGVDLSRAIAWDGFSFNPDASSDIDDAAITDAGNATESGYDQYGGTIPLFYPANMSDVTSDYVQAYEAFKTQNVKGWIVIRFDPEIPWTQAFAAGDVIDVYKVVSDYTAHDTAGEDSVKFMVEFLPQGALSMFTQVKGGAMAAIGATAVSVAVGAYETRGVTLAGLDYTQGATWASSDASKATVTPNGVIKGVAAGSATVTATHPAGAAPVTFTVTVT